MAPLVAWRRRSAQRRRGADLVVALRRETAGGFGVLRCRLDAPARRYAELAAALAGAVAEGASRLGATVGCAGVVAGDEPVLVALAPARDLVAARVRETLERGEAHRRPELWLTLPPGRYLAQAIDPLAPFDGDEAAIVALLRSGAARCVLRTEVASGAASVAVAATLYAPGPDLRMLFSVARAVLRGVPGWTLTR